MGKILKFKPRIRLEYKSNFFCISPSLTIMKNIQFPLFKTKLEKPTPKFNLTDPTQRREYFQLKVGPEIKKLKNYLQENTFIAYLLGKKNSGKGTYSKMFAEIIDPFKIEHFSIGDMVREVDKELVDPERRKRLVSFLERNYRGFFSLEEIIKKLKTRDTKTLLPTELILALVKREIAKREKKALFIDGFPRNLDQVSFTLFFRDLIGYREDPDVFILIDVPESVIDERIKWRRICPLCQTSRNLKLFPTSKVDYDQEQENFCLICDNPNCQGARMVPKEGDELGIGAIRNRLKTDEQLMKQAFSLYGIPKILLRNSVPVEKAPIYIDNYEITPEYYYEWDSVNKRVKIFEKPWKIPNDEGVLSYSLLAAPVVVSLIAQMVKALSL